MRRCWPCALLLMLFLAMGVSACETPETCDWADDVSNPLLVVGIAANLPPVPSRRPYPHELTRPTLGRPSTYAKISKHHFWFGPTLDASSKAGRDVLQFLSIERK